MTTLRIHIEINIGGGWYTISPKECILLGYPCPKYPSSVFEDDNWEFTLLGNHFFIAVMTGEKNPNQLIKPVSKDILWQDFSPQLAGNLVQECIQVSEKLGKTVTHFVGVKSYLFLDTEYWSTVYNGSLELRYRDLIEDYDLWLSLSEKLLGEFDTFRFIFWLED